MSYGFFRFFAYLNKRSSGERFILLTAIFIFLSAGIYTIWQVNQTYLTALPATGGSLNEGMVGAPRFINPVLAITRVDQDLTALLYNSLMKIGENGALEPDAIETITISDDGKVYNIVLKDNLTFNDGTPVTADDVAFTIELIQNAELKSPLRGNWGEVTVEVVGEKELNFILNEAYIPFAENLTVGILPKHIWNTLSIEELPFSQYNTRPVGSGLYEVDAVERTTAGLISSYSLIARAEVTPEPLISRIKIFFYQNEEAVLEAYKNGVITSTSALTNEMFASITPQDGTLISSPLPRVFGIFINHNRSVALRDKAVREALDLAIDREALVDRALYGFGEPTTLPVPTGFHELQSTTSLTVSSSSIEAAKTQLLKGGWKFDEESAAWRKLIDGETVSLSLTLTTANNLFFSETAAYLKESWEALGIPVTLALYEQADLVQTVIRPRDFQLLLFGTDVGRSLDMYPFWHSSEREDPGLNVALYTNITTDKILEEYRTTTDAATRNRQLAEFVSILTKETPAIFLFNPSFVFVVKPQVFVTPITHMGRPSDRFSTIASWYTKEDKLWPLFTY